MTTKLKYYSLFLILSIALSVNGQQDDKVVDQVTKAIKNTNADDLAEFFFSTIDLEVGDTDGSFSKSQANIIVRDFFTKNQKKSFQVKHKGSSDDGSKYIIGAYITQENKEFRVYILLKKTENQLLINQLQFEKD